MIRVKTRAWTHINALAVLVAASTFGLFAGLLVYAGLCYAKGRYVQVDML